MYREPKEDLTVHVQHLLNILKEYDESLSSISKKLDAVFDEEPNDLEDYLIEYSRLFMGPFKLFAPPFASIYLEDKWEVMGRSTQVIESFYQQAGLSVNTHSEPVDHISLQLEFMYYLNRKWNETKDGNLLNLQKEFLYKILTHWIPKFNEALQQNASLEFYKILGELTECFIQKDFASLK